MRYSSLLPPLLIALTVAACAREQPAYYVTNSVTGQRIAMGQQDASQGHRGFAAAGSTQATGYNSYAAATPQHRGNSDRGLFGSDVFDSGALQSSWFSRQPRAPTYALQAQPQQTYTPPPQTAQAQPSHTYAPQTYSYQPPPPQAYAQQPATVQYRPPQPAPQQYYHPPQPQPTSYYAPQYRMY